MTPSLALTINCSFHDDKLTHYYPNHHKLSSFESVFKKTYKRPSLSILANVDLEPEDCTIDEDEQLNNKSYIDLDNLPTSVAPNQSQFSQQVHYQNPNLFADNFEGDFQASTNLQISSDELSTYLNIFNEHQKVTSPPKIMENKSEIVIVPSETLKRKRELNRIASAECKRRKVERIIKLESIVKIKKSENKSLEQVQERLLKEIYCLEYELSQHVRNKFCSINMVGNKLVMRY